VGWEGEGGGEGVGWGGRGGGVGKGWRWWWTGTAWGVLAHVNL